MLEQHEHGVQSSATREGEVPVSVGWIHVCPVVAHRSALDPLSGVADYQGTHTLEQLNHSICELADRKGKSKFLLQGLNFLG